MMSDVAIQIRDLGKLYHIGAKQDSARVTTFRDQIGHAARSTVRKLLRRSQRANKSAVFWALKGVSLEIKKGDVIGIIGRNGAGKSTLLKILSQITEPTTGEIDIHGRVGSLLEVGTGFHPELSGRENIYLNGAMLGMKRAEITRKFDEIVAFSEVEKFLDTPVKRYSSGMYTRLAFAVAAHLETEILIVDEVLAVGDAQFQKKCLGKMTEVAHGGRTVLFVSHSMSAVSRLCSTCVLLSGGKVHSHGPTQEIIPLYLKSGEASETCQVRFDTVPVRPSQFTSVGFYGTDGIPTSEISCDDPISIRIEYEVREKVYGLYFAFYLQNSIGVTAIFSDSRDAGKLESNDLSVGRYALDIVIPPRLLAPDRYFLTIGSAASGSGHVHNVQSCCSMVLHDFSTSRQSRPGVIGTILDWKLQRGEISPIGHLGGSE